MWGEGRVLRKGTAMWFCGVSAELITGGKRVC